MNCKTYINVILEKGIYKIYIYQLKKANEDQECNTLEKEYYNEELYCENNKTLVLGHLINDLMKSDIM